MPGCVRAVYILSDLHIFNSITKNKVFASKIFDWYKAYFGNLITAVNTYSDTKIDPNVTVEYGLRLGLE